MDATDRRARAESAQQLLDHPLFREAFDGVERRALDALAAANLADGPALIHATALLQAARLVREYVGSIANTGKMQAQTPPAVA